MTKTELAMLLARERVKAQAELLAQAPDLNPELAAILKGANLYDHALQESLKQVENTSYSKTAKTCNCWSCHEDNFFPHAMGDEFHPFYLCMSCGATSTDNELHPYHKALYLPYKKLAGEVSRLLGDARRAKLPLGCYQKKLAERCQ